MSIWIPDGTLNKFKQDRLKNLFPVMKTVPPPWHSPFNADFDGDVGIDRSLKRRLYSQAMGRRSPFFKHTRKQRGRK